MASRREKVRIGALKKFMSIHPFDKDLNGTKRDVRCRKYMSLSPFSEDDGGGFIKGWVDTLCDQAKRFVIHKDPFWASIVISKMTCDIMKLYKRGSGPTQKESRDLTVCIIHVMRKKGATGDDWFFDFVVAVSCCGMLIKKEKDEHIRTAFVKSIARIPGILGQFKKLLSDDISLGNNCGVALFYMCCSVRKVFEPKVLLEEFTEVDMFRFILKYIEDQQECNEGGGGDDTKNQLVDIIVGLASSDDIHIRRYAFESSVFSIFIKTALADDDIRAGSEKSKIYAKLLWYFGDTYFGDDDDDDDDEEKKEGYGIKRCTAISNPSDYISFCVDYLCVKMGEISVVEATMVISAMFRSGIMKDQPLFLKEYLSGNQERLDWISSLFMCIVSIGRTSSEREDLVTPELKKSVLDYCQILKPKAKVGYKTEEFTTKQFYSGGGGGGGGESYKETSKKELFSTVD